MKQGATINPQRDRMHVDKMKYWMTLREGNFVSSKIG